MNKNIDSHLIDLIFLVSEVLTLSLQVGYI